MVGGILLPSLNREGLGVGLYQPLCRPLFPIQHHVLDDLQLFCGNVAVHHLRGGVHNTEVHTGLNGVVEEDGMHGFADVVVAAERERQVADAAADVGAGQVLAYPSGGTDKVDGIGVVFLHTSSDGQYIGVKDNIERIHANTLSQKLICTTGNLYATFVGRCLSLLVEAHHHHGSAVAHAVSGVTQEDFFALLQRDTVDDRLALYALQSGGNDVPLR